MCHEQFARFGVGGNDKALVEGAPHLPQHRALPGRVEARRAENPIRTFAGRENVVGLGVDGQTEPGENDVTKRPAAGRGRSILWSRSGFRPAQ